MRVSLDFCRLLILSSLCLACASDITISPDKTPAVEEYCGLTAPYEFQVAADQYEGNDGIEQATQDMFPLDGDQLVREFLKDGIGGFARVMGEYPSISGLNYGILLGGLGLALFLAPILVCCCCCPDRCPPFTCRDPSKQYKSCELCWPNICIIVFSSLIMALCIYILVESRKFDGVYQDFKCSMSLVTNNFLYGSKNTQGQGFFAGLVTISDQVEDLQKKLPEFSQAIQDLTNSSNIVSDFYNQGQNVLTQISKIPTGTEGQEMALSYSIPFLLDAPAGSLPSLFPSVLGTSDENTTLVGEWYAGTETLMDRVDLVTQPSWAFLAGASDFESANLTMMKQAISDVESVSFKISKTFSILDNGVIKIILIGSYVILGLTIFFSLTLTLGACGLLCYKYSCRNVVYCSCIVLWLLTLAHFLLALFFSFSTPLVYYGCGYLTEGFDNPALFQSNLEPIFDNSTIGHMLSQCLTPNNGDALLKAFLDEEVYYSISSLNLLVDGLSHFNATAYSHQYNSTFLNVTAQIRSYQHAEVLDFNSDSQLAELTKISTASQYATCTDAGFIADSWIPSVSQSPVYTPCQVTGSNATLQECPNYLFVNRLDQCQGCMDSYSIMSEYQTKQDVVATMNSRYPSCTQFTAQFGNLWENFYMVKRNAIQPVVTRVEAAINSSLELEKQLSSVSDYFATEYAKLTNNYGSIMDPKEGILVGLDCTVVKQSIDVAMEIFCVNGLLTSYYLRFLFAAMAFSLLLLLCCGICSGTRHYMQEKIEDESRESLAKKRAQEDVELMEKQLSEKRFIRYY